MKKPIAILGIVLFSFSLQAQSIKNQLGTNGNFVVLDENADTAIVSDENSFKLKLGDENGRFVILNNGTPGVDEFVKLLIRESGEVNWFLDGQSMFIRDGAFDAYGDGFDYKYDFLRINGNTGRIGFNILDGRTDNTSDPASEEVLTSSVTLFGSLATRVRIVNIASGDDYELKQDDHTLIFNPASGSGNVILPDVSSCIGRQYVLKNTDNSNSDELIVIPQIGQKLNGEVNGEISLKKIGAAVTLVCDGVSWWSLGGLDVETQNTSTVSVDINAGSVNVIEVNFTSNSQTIKVNLPDAGAYKGHSYHIKRNANGTPFTSNILNIEPTGSDVLDQFTVGSPYIMANIYESVTIRSNGSRWLIVSSYNH